MSQSQNDQRIRFNGGPLDGAEILLPVDYRLPDEIYFRNPRYLPHKEHAYRLDFSRLLILTIDTLTKPSYVYEYVAHSEVFSLIHAQAQRIVCLESDLSKKEKTIERLEAELRRARGIVKANATRRRKARQQKSN